VGSVVLWVVSDAVVLGAIESVCPQYLDKALEAKFERDKK